MLPSGSLLSRLLDGPVRPGTVRWLGLRPARRAPMAVTQTVQLDPELGVVGDRWQGRPGGTRQVTLVAEEHLAAIARFLGRDAVPPALLRRNIAVSGINLLALRGRQVRIGGALIEVTGECHPCSRMEQELGPGGYNAVRGQGGVTAKVLEGGTVRVGDVVSRGDL